ncbi:hypothetical protein PILCRDRAFT_117542 [Piloderma croceum F 1598]|uniref:Uncharacterized protein n=1 Tax=Piloderma croceum (strain F 1598) TaxID=765440 RepID=A0A0C3GNZ2_PILCF|nr:hypothetical protein PILCRDRAFT_117542 [Piloderma croceum F 1598]
MYGCISTIMFTCAFRFMSACSGNVRVNITAFSVQVTNISILRVLLSLLTCNTCCSYGTAKSSVNIFAISVLRPDSMKDYCIPIMMTVSLP